LVFSVEEAMLSTGIGQANPPRWFNTASSFAFTER